MSATLHPREFEQTVRRALDEIVQRTVAKMLHAADAAKLDMGERGAAIIIPLPIRRGDDVSLYCHCPDEATLAEFHRRYRAHLQSADDTGVLSRSVPCPANCSKPKGHWSRDKKQRPSDLARTEDVAAVSPHRNEGRAGLPWAAGQARTHQV